MKYIVLEVIDHDKSGYERKRELPVLFADTFIHKQMAEVSIKQLLREKPREVRHREVTTVSAGFFNAGCFGMSESLDLASRGPVDNTLLAQHGVRS